jgi:ADP-heptose:LPS heptosyltransferase
MAKREVGKVLVIKLSALGDFVLALAAMKKIREAHPEAWINLLTTQPFEQLARASPYFNHVDAGGRPEGFGEWLQLVARIRAEKYDRVYDLQTSSRTNMIFQALRPFPPAWSGVAAGCSLRHRNPQRDQMHTLERQADQLRYAGIWPDAPTEPYGAPPPDVSWILARAPKERAPRPDDPKPKPYVLLAPGGSAHRLEKRWPAEKFGQAAEAFLGQGFDVFIIGGTQEASVAHAIQRVARRARDLTGRTDFARIALMAAKAALAVGNDTGPLHLMAAAGCPTIALFSKASDPALSGPRGHVAVLQAPDLDDLPVELVLQAAATLTPSPQLSPA